MTIFRRRTATDSAPIVAWDSDRLRLIREILARRGVRVAGPLLLIIAVVCIASPLIAPYSPQAQDLTHTLSLPSWHHLLGTDELGRDILSRLLYGGTSAMLGIVEAVGTAVVLSVPLGLVAGYFGGGFRQLVDRAIDIGLAIPSIIVLLVVLAIFDRNMTATMVTLGVLFAPGMARVTIVVAASVREDLYVEAAIASGFASSAIIRRHVLPRVTGAVLVQVTIAAASALILQSGVSLLGLGSDPSTPTWGGMLADGQQLM